MVGSGAACGAGFPMTAFADSAAGDFGVLVPADGQSSSVAALSGYGGKSLVLLGIVHLAVPL